jgi:murein peptide amidase A
MVKKWFIIGWLALSAQQTFAKAPSVDGCADFYKTLPNLSMALCKNAKLVASGATSIKGRPLYVRNIGSATAKRRVLVLGAMHGDELSSASTVFHWLAFANTQPEDVQWRFVPAVNPDGLFSRPARRTNANGVDLNRNFPTPKWEVESVRYWQVTTKRDARRWPGKKSMSEPETRFVLDQLEKFKPHLVVSVHAPYGVLDFDGAILPPAQLGRLHLDQVGVFPGSLGNFGGLHKGIPVITVELPAALATPRNVEIRQMWEDLNEWIKEKLTDMPDKSAKPAETTKRLGG